MANKHVIKLTENEAVVKVYATDAAGNTITISLQSDLTKQGETYTAGTSAVTIRKIFWGTKNNKHIDLQREVIASPGTYHGHYYFINAGTHDYVGFVDDLYKTGDIRVVSDGPFHMILVLGKEGF